MGSLATELSRRELRNVADQLADLTRSTRQMTGQVINAAAAYKAIRALAADSADTAALDARLAEAIAASKADLDKLDATTKAIVTQFLNGILGR